jgi:hypothetical protein
MKTIGDSVEYTRHADGTLVRGVVKYVLSRSHHPDQFHSQVAEEDVAYRLDLSLVDEVRVGHPVTIGHSRVRA